MCSSKCEIEHINVQKSEENISELLATIARQGQQLRFLRKRVHDIQSLLETPEPEEKAVSAANRPDVSIEHLIDRIEIMIKTRAMRAAHLQHVEFGEAPWDMLLDLTVARYRSRRTSVSSLCIAAGVPTTTALRCLKSLIDGGIVERVPDPGDRRRSFVSIGDEAYADMIALARAVIQHEQRRKGDNRR